MLISKVKKKFLQSSQLSTLFLGDDEIIWKFLIHSIEVKIFQLEQRHHPQNARELYFAPRFFLRQKGISLNDDTLFDTDCKKIQF
jgi:hypothetical protein